jgi:histidinol-phosphate aminotransferase
MTELRLDANECPIDERFAARIAASSTLLGRYPDARSLESQLADLIGVRADELLVTAGSDDALARIVDRRCRGRRVVVLDPTFTLIPRLLETAGADLVRVPWWSGPLPVDALGAAGRDADVVFVVSPNNPTGSAASPEELVELRRLLPRPLLVLDAAYEEFAARPLAGVARSLERTLVLRTFSKARGLAGIRVGWVSGPRDVIEELRSAAPPYAVAGPSLATATAALAEDDALARRIDRVRSERSAIGAELRALGMDVLPSDANFVLVRCASPAEARLLRASLASLGVVVRGFTEPSLGRCLRITMPASDVGLDRLRRSLRAALAPDALLFDMDGVLADVSRSYRRCIEETVREFGVRVGPADIARAKRAGDANDDWALSWRLIRDGGGTATLDDVTRRFEARYQGSDDSLGLRATESPLIDEATLGRLAARGPLGIVTGRPRIDAERFLRDFGLARFFSIVVCREDAPLKPSPDPIRAACERLGVATAWFVGDTVDDVRAARATGPLLAVVPLGVLPPGDDGSSTRPALEAAGAAFVASNATDLARFLLDRSEARS